MLFTRPLALAALLLPLAALPSLAQQDYDRPPAGYQDDPSGGAGYRYGGPSGPSGGGGSDLGDAGAVSVRVGKLESRIREMTGQIEELQNANRRLVEQVTKFQADVDFRLQSKGSAAAPSKRSDASGLGGAPMDADPVTPPAKLADSKLLRRGDAFDPAASPSAPGTPKPLGTVAAASPDAGDAPIDLSGGRNVGTGSSGAIAPTLQLPSATTPKSTGGTVTPNGTVIASIAPNSPKEEFDVALGYYKDKQYEAAEKGFTAFMTKNPKSRLNADATYYLGESYAQRGRQREAAEQYLKISTDYAQSPRAPEAMLRLGVSLKALGAKEQACSAFTEIGRKYPAAPAYVKTGAEREAKRAQC